MIAWLVTWLWQGVALTLFVTLIVRATHASAATRYVLWWMTLAGVLWLGWSGGQVLLDPSPQVEGVGDQLGSFVLRLPPTSSLMTWILAVAWGAMIAIGLARIAAALFEVRRLTLHTRDFPSARELRLTRWSAARRDDRPVRLAVSDEIQGVVVLGLRQPRIAVARGLLDHLTDDELDQIVLHELAHIERRDAWMQLLQLVLTAVAGFHPAVRWASDQLTLEREVACDDRVVAETGVPRSYARCLARVAEWQLTRRALVCAPAFLARSNHFPLRIERLLDKRRNGRTRPSAIALGVGFGLVSFGHMQLAAWPPLVTETALLSVVMPGVSIPLSDNREVHIDIPGPEAQRQSLPAARRHPSPHQRPEHVDPIVPAARPTLAGPPPDSVMPLPSRSHGNLQVDSNFADALQVDIRPADTIFNEDPQPRWAAAPANPWTAVAATARRASVGTAAAFTRAGKSLASAFASNQERP